VAPGVPAVVGIIVVAAAAAVIATVVVAAPKGPPPVTVAAFVAHVGRPLALRPAHDLHQAHGKHEKRPHEEQRGGGEGNQGDFPLEAAHAGPVAELDAVAQAAAAHLGSKNHALT
jgi:hypothetical protein